MQDCLSKGIYPNADNRSHNITPCATCKEYHHTAQNIHGDLHFQTIPPFTQRTTVQASWKAEWWIPIELNPKCHPKILSSLHGPHHKPANAPRAYVNKKGGNFPAASQLKFLMFYTWDNRFALGLAVFNGIDGQNFEQLLHNVTCVTQPMSLT